MSKFFKFGLAIVLLLFFGCNKIDEANTLKIDEVTEIKLGKTVKNSEYGISLQVESVNDSRCPIGVQCVWEGNAYVEFQLTTKQGSHKFTLDTHDPPNFKKDTLIEGIKYQLIDVLPYPIHNKKQSAKTVTILANRFTL